MRQKSQADDEPSSPQESISISDEAIQNKNWTGWVIGQVGRKNPQAWLFFYGP